MKCKKACLVINPRAGQNLARLTHVMAVFAAAGWKTDIAIKEYGGHTMELGTQAAEKNYDLVIAYGGDGTLTVVHEDSPSKFSVVENVPTLRRARTIALDAKTHQVYTITAEFGQAPALEVVAQAAQMSGPAHSPRRSRPTR